MNLEDGPCHVCGEGTCSVAGNPGLWPLRFPAIDSEPGKCVFWHTGCVMARMAENARLRDAIKRIAAIGMHQQSGYEDSCNDMVYVAYGALKEAGEPIPTDCSPYEIGSLDRRLEAVLADSDCLMSVCDGVVTITGDDGREVDVRLRDKP